MRLRPLACLLAALAAGLAGCAPQSEAVWPTDLPATQSQLEQMRSSLQQTLWGHTGVPQIQGQVSESNADAALVPANVAAVSQRIQLLAVPLRFGLTSKVRLITPKHVRNCSLVLIGGHAVVWEGGGDVIASAALTNGCSIALVEMPGQGLNGEIIAVRPDGVRLQLNDQNGGHNAFQMLESDGQPVLDLFVNPVIAAIQQLSQDTNTVPVVAGLSGGAFLTVLAAAADPEVHDSLSVAGFGNSTGVDDCRDDYEQCTPTFYSKVSPSQLRVMAAAPAGRTHIDQFNRTDICCFAYATVPEWASPVSQSAQQLGGHYELQLYDFPGHAYGLQAVTVLSTMLGTT